MDYKAAVPQVGSQSAPSVGIAAENEYERTIREITMDNARELLMGKLRGNCERNGPSCTPSPAPPCV